MSSSHCFLFCTCVGKCAVFLQVWARAHSLATPLKVSSLELEGPQLFVFRLHSCRVYGPDQNIIELMFVIVAVVHDFGCVE